MLKSNPNRGAYLYKNSRIDGRFQHAFLAVVFLPWLLQCTSDGPARVLDADVSFADSGRIDSSPDTGKIVVADASPGTGTADANSQAPAYCSELDKPEPTPYLAFAASSIVNDFGSANGVIQLGEKTADGWLFTVVSGPATWKEGALITGNGALPGAQSGDRFDVDLNSDCQAYSGCKQTLLVRAKVTGELAYFQVASDAAEDGRHYQALGAPITLLPVCQYARTDGCRKGGVVSRMAIKIGVNAPVAEGAAGLITIKGQTLRLVVQAAHVTTGGQASTCTDMGTFFNGRVNFVIARQTQM